MCVADLAILEGTGLGLDWTLVSAGTFSRSSLSDRDFEFKE